MEDFEALPVLEKEGVMEFFAGDESLYQTVLEGFEGDHGKDGIKLKKLIAEGDIENAVITAHSLKSTCRTIGAKKLSAIAAFAEKELSQKGELQTSVVTEIIKETAKLIARI